VQISSQEQLEIESTVTINYQVRGILHLLSRVSIKISKLLLIFRLEDGDKAFSWDVTIQRCILVLLDLIQVLVAMSNSVFVSVCASLVTIYFGANDQLVSSDLLSTHGSGGREETAQKGEKDRG
jgi:hypothetical protein